MTRRCRRKPSWRLMSSPISPNGCRWAHLGRRRNPRLRLLRSARQAMPPIMIGFARNIGPGSLFTIRPCPSVTNKAWPRTDLDRYVLGKLEEKGLETGCRCRQSDTIRRVTFDLTGLPPTPKTLAPSSPMLLPMPTPGVVDQLLASPAFGERWGRHWLDVARFGESTGSTRNVPYPLRLALSRLRHRFVQQGQALRPVLSANKLPAI